MEQLVALQSSIENVTRKLYDLFIGVGGFQVTYEKGVSTRNSNLILQSLENRFFHVDDLDVGVIAEGFKGSKNVGDLFLLQSTDGVTELQKVSKATTVLTTYIVTSVGSVADINQVTKLWWVDLFVFRSNQ